MVVVRWHGDNVRRRYGGELVETHSGEGVVGRRGLLQEDFDGGLGP